MNKQALSSKLRAAFSDVQLGEGIGYFEAVAIDDYIAQDSPEYEKIRNRHERGNWEVTLQEFEGWRSCANVTAFMDREGLLYFLPIFLSNDGRLEKLPHLVKSLSPSLHLKIRHETSQRHQD